MKFHLKPGGWARVCSLERQGGVQVRHRGHHCKSQRLRFKVTLYSGGAQVPSSAQHGAGGVGPGGNLTNKRTPHAGFGFKFNTSQCTAGWSASASVKVECRYDAAGITANHSVSIS